MRTGTLTNRPRNHAEPAVRPTPIRPMQRIGRGIVHPTSLTQTLEHRGIPPAIASPIFVNPLVEFIHLLRSSAPNSLLSSCRASSTACFSFLMVFTIPGRTSRASGDLSFPEMVSFSVVWRMSIRCCRICQALPDSPLRRRFSNCDEMRAFSFIRLAAARAAWPFTPPLHRDRQH